MLITYIEPILFYGKIANQISTRVNYYDMKSKRCYIYLKVSNETDGVYYTETWEVPEEILINWGTDDMVIVQALANDKGFTII